MEKNNKIIKIYNIIFWLNLINLVLNIIAAVFMSLAEGRIAIYNYIELLMYSIATIFVFVCKKIAYKELKITGIIGIIIAVAEIIFAGFIWKIIGIILLVNSISYLNNYNKNN